jgi:hypothetical protein
MVKLNLRRELAAVGVVLAAVSSAACEPTFDDRNSQVLERRVLAVRSMPAQARPMAEVKLSALVVEPTGTLKSFAPKWAFCNAPKPIAETNDVSDECLAGSGDQFDELGRGAIVTGNVPDYACRLFGPSVPPSEPGQPPGRPKDADSTGSFYQPLRVIVPSADTPIVTLGQVGLTCQLTGLSGEQLSDYQKRARVNEHPELSNVLVGAQASTPLSIDDGGAEPTRVSPRQHVVLRATWPECPTEGVCGDGICNQDENAQDCEADCTQPKGCHGAETFVYYDPETHLLEGRREAMRVSWFAGAGSFDDDHTGRREDELQTYSDATWTAPSQPGLAHLWVVLRDSRSGITWQSYVVDVE